MMIYPGSTQRRQVVTAVNLRALRAPWEIIIPPSPYSLGLLQKTRDREPIETKGCYCCKANVLGRSFPWGNGQSLALILLDKKKQDRNNAGGLEKENNGPKAKEAVTGYSS